MNGINNYDARHEYMNIEQLNIMYEVRKTTKTTFILFYFSNFLENLQLKVYIIAT